MNRRRVLYRRRAMKKRKLLYFTFVFWGLACMAALAFLKVDPGFAGQDFGEQVGKQYLASAYPIISRNAGLAQRESPENPEEIDDTDYNLESNSLKVDTHKTANDSGIIDTASGGDPVVLIYHTHATESYIPVSDGNFHSPEEAGTVREVGNALESALMARGISVLHDKTIHDLPSYSKSYSRSMDTATAILKENPSIAVVIDLHRDAAAYSGNQSHVFSINGENAAQFSLVVGQGNENSGELLAFADRIIGKANEKYPGFARGVIKKEYKYNQYISDRYLLLEMGNNQNDIKEAKRSAVYFADILEEVIKGSGN